MKPRANPARASATAEAPLNAKPSTVLYSTTHLDG